MSTRCSFGSQLSNCLIFKNAFSLIFVLWLQECLLTFFWKKRQVDMNATLGKILTLCLLILYSNYVTEILRCSWLIGEFREARKSLNFCCKGLWIVYSYDTLQQVQTQYLHSMNLKRPKKLLSKKPKCYRVQPNKIDSYSSMQIQSG